MERYVIEAIPLNRVDEWIQKIQKRRRIYFQKLILVMLGLVLTASGLALEFGRGTLLGLELGPRIQLVQFALTTLGITLMLLGVTFNDVTFINKRQQSQTQKATDNHALTPLTQSTAQRLTSWYPPTMPQHLRDGIAVDFEEACADTKT